MKNICSMPELLEGMYILNYVVTVLKIMVPIIIIITGMYSFFKATLNADADSYKASFKTLMEKLMVGAFIFFVPTFVNSFFNLVAPNSSYMSCFTNATKEYIQDTYLAYADKYILLAEDSFKMDDYDKAHYYVLQLDPGTKKDAYQARLDAVYKAIRDNWAKEREEKKKKSVALNLAREDSYDNVGSYSTTGNATAQPGVYQNSEPDPSAAVNYWKNYINTNNFVYYKDKTTGLPLGAWPKNWETIPTQLTSYNTYADRFIYPVTTYNSSCGGSGYYGTVYNHQSIDLMAEFGTPVYSPVDGSLTYSEWGHTVNRGGDETAYSISIRLHNPITIGGKQISIMFLTHLSGIRYRCSSGTCNRNVQKGELLGYVGNAAGDAYSVGWAPHLHMTFYTSGGDALYTQAVESLYGLYACKPMKAGS